MENVIVTTGDLQERYEVIGPVYYQINNRPMGFSGKSKLSIKESEYAEIARNNRESSGIGLVSALFMPVAEFGPGDSKFTTAFYIAVEELKKQAQRMGGDAVVAMRQDIDIDSNGFQYFYLQMYGTAVKRIVEAPAQPVLPAESQAAEPEKIEQIPVPETKAPEGFWKEALWEALCALKTTQEMVACLEQTAADYPGVLSEEVLQKAKNCITLERIYGKGVGVQEVQKLIKKHLEL